MKARGSAMVFVLKKCYSASFDDLNYFAKRHFIECVDEKIWSGEIGVKIPIKSLALLNE